MAAKPARPGVLDRGREWVRRARSRYAGLDHAFRAYDRNSEVLGTQLAAAITYFGFLSFFPLLALGFSIVGYLSDGDPAVQQKVTDAVESTFPGLVGTESGQINIQNVIDAKAGAGLIALLGLAYAGLGWIDALRDALRRVFGTSGIPIPFVKKKVIDVLILVALGVAVLASLVVSSLATSVTRQALDLVGLSDSTLAVALLKVLSVALSLLADIVVFAIVLGRLSGASLPFRQVRSGALLAAIGFEVLKLLATFLIGKTLTNPLYATFGVIVGLLLWINFVSRLLVFAAAWTATRPYSLEPAPAGEEGAGRSTGLAASTEPVTPVAPSDFPVTPVPAARDDARCRRQGWRRSLVGMAVGAGAALALTRRRSR
jgi:membrane protein